MVKKIMTISLFGATALGGAKAPTVLPTFAFAP